MNCFWNSHMGHHGRQTNNLVLTCTMCYIQTVGLATSSIILNIQVNSTWTELATKFKGMVRNWNNLLRA